MLAECGTYAAAQRHKKRGEHLDDACKAADRQYAADWRMRNPAARRVTVQRENAARRVHRRMAGWYPDEFERAQAFELEKDPEVKPRTLKARAAKRVAEVGHPTEYARLLEEEYRAPR